MTTESAPAKPGLAAFAIVGTLTAALGILATIARTKVVARVVGPEGIGITAEVSQLVTLATIGATIAGGPALLNRIAAADRDGDDERVRRSVRAAVGLGGALALAGGIASIALAPYVLPRSNEYPVRLYVALAAIATGLGALSGVAQTLFVGRSNLRAIATTSVIPLVLSTAASIGLTLAFALRGQFYAMAIGAVVTLGCALLYLRMQTGRASVSFRPAFDWAFIKDALVLGATGLIAGYFGQFLYATIRETLEVVGGHADGARFNGNYQAAFAIGATYYTMMLGSLGTYFSPRFAASTSEDELTKHVRDAERFVLVVAPPVVLMAIAFRADLIRLLYDDRFDLAISILGYQLAGDVARGVATVSASPLLVRGKVRAFLILEGLGVGFGILFNVVLIPRLGPVGTGVAYVATYVFYLFASCIVLRRACGVPIAARPVVLALAFTALAIGVEIATRQFPVARWAMLPALLFWMWRSGTLGRVFARVSRLARPRVS